MKERFWTFRFLVAPEELEAWMTNVMEIHRLSGKYKRSHYGSVPLQR